MVFAIFVCLFAGDDYKLGDVTSQSNKVRRQMDESYLISPDLCVLRAQTTQ